MTDETPDAPRSGFTLDLSSGAASKPKRPKGFVPVVQKTINLTTKRRDEARAAAGPRPDAAPEAARQAGTPRADTRRDEPRPNEPRPASTRRDELHGNRDGRGAGRRDEPRRDEPRPADRPSSGTSLADLLDEATLARLRGGR